MRSFDYSRLAEKAWDTDILNLVAKIHECKGRQDLFIRQKPVELDRLVEIAKIQSTESSNKIEGIVTTSTRMKQLFEDLKTGKINAFYLKSEKTFQCWHRSTKEAGKIQVSEGFYKDNELIPCCDVQLETFRDFLTEGYPPGIYETI